MELNAKTLQEVTFGAKVRGYDPAEVDEFIAAVAEGVEELHERLRRATERATRAEQQLAAAPAETTAAVATDTPVQTVSASAEASKVLERVVLAAEQAMEEAKAEAQRLLDETRNRADTQLNDARREAEQTVSNAKSEAARITEESQAQLRVEIQKLEAARESLNADVSGLASWLDNERNRLRGALEEALSNIEQYGSGAGPLVDLAPSPFLADAAPVTTATEDWASTSTTTSVAEPDWIAPQESSSPDAQSNDWAGEPTQHEEESFVPSWAQPEAEGQIWQGEESGSTEGSWQDSQASESEDDKDGDTESDPFLAELRRAVQDDGPLGPRSEEEDSSLSDLYAADDDNNGFFRRNK